MNIDRNNYEEFFVLYIDKELNAADRAAVEAFIVQNPDLRTELEMLEQTILPLDHEPLSFNKEFLLKPESINEEKSADTIINKLNCEEYFVLYGDNELNNDQNALVEAFIYRHPEYQEHFELIQEAKLEPEKHIVFRDKSVLYRSEKDGRVVPMFPAMRTWKIAAAAAVMLMIGGTVWYALNTGTRNNLSPGLATQTGVQSKPANNDAAVKDPATIQRPSTTETATLPSNALSTQQASVAKSSKESGENISGSNSESRTKKLNTTRNKIEAVNTTDLASTEKISTNTKENNRRLSTDKSLAKASAKKVDNKSNILTSPDVQLSKADEKIDLAMNDKRDEKNAVEQSLTNTSKSEKVPDHAVAIGPVELKPDNVFVALANENDEEFEQSDKKNKMRGFFRKVTRVFDKATSREPAENRKGVRIASFSIGLK
jgi:hypothetical protein